MFLLRFSVIVLSKCSFMINIRKEGKKALILVYIRDFVRVIVNVIVYICTEKIPGTWHGTSITNSRTVGNSIRDSLSYIQTNLFFWIQ